MSDNFDIALATLCQETRDLVAQGQSVMIETGKCIIAIRALLREQYGNNLRSPKDCLGEHSPAVPGGWGKWCQTMFGKRSGTLMQYMQYANFPEEFEKHRVRTNRSSTRSRSYTAEGLIYRVKKIWPKLSDEEKHSVIDVMVSL